MITLAEIREELKEIFSRYRRDKSELIPVLQAVQNKYGYLPGEAMVEVSHFLHVPPSNVFGVASFYALFRFLPVGKRVIKVCRGTACHVRGSVRLVDEIEKLLKIKPGETTGDLQFSLEVINCFGSCALAPVMVVNEDVYGRMTPAKVAEVLGIKKGS